MNPTHRLIGAVIAAIPLTQDLDAGHQTETWDVLGIELPCQDAERASRFYRSQLGYELERKLERGVLLRLGEVLLALNEDRTPETSPSGTPIYLNHRVANLTEAASQIERAGGKLIDDQARTFVLGRSMGFLDPEGNPGRLVRLTDETEPDADLPALFNLSLRTPDLESVERFFCEDLGFEVHSRAYLPKTLPFKKRGAAMVVAHRQDGSGETGPETREPCARLLMVLPSRTSPTPLPGKPWTSNLFGAARKVDGPAGIQVLGIAPGSWLPSSAEGVR